MALWPPVPGKVTTPTEDNVAALFAEREGYIARGLPARVALVDVELRKLGADPDGGDLDTLPEPAPADEGLPAAADLDDEDDPDDDEPRDDDLPVIPKAPKKSRG